MTTPLAKTILNRGRTVELQTLGIRPTYLGLAPTEAPDLKTRFVTGNHADTHEGHGIPAFLVLPYTEIKYPHPKDETVTWSRYPQFRLEGLLFSGPIRKAPYSSLTVVWLVETLPDNILPVFLEAIRDICWEAKAMDGAV